MALLKAFVCQVILLGLYKLFLEQVVEDHLVPDELTRNCLVGLVCLVCFGIQLYTDKAEDEDCDEVDEKPKSESRREESAKKSESNHEAFVSNSSSQVKATKPKTISREITTAKNMSFKDKQVLTSSKNCNAVQLAEKVAEATHLGIFAQYSSNISDTIPGVNKEDGMGEPKVPACESHDQKTIIPELNGFSEAKVCEESDEDGIEIDQFVAKQKAKEAVRSKTVRAEEVDPIKAEKSKTVRVDEVEPIKDEDDTEEAIQVRAVEDCKVTKPGDVAEDAKQLQTVKNEAVAIGHDYVIESVSGSECLAANGEDISSTQDSNKTSVLKVGEPEAQVANGLESLNNTDAEEHLNNTDKISSNFVEEIPDKTIEDYDKIGNGKATTLSSEPEKQFIDIAEPVASAQEMGNTISSSTKSGNNVKTVNKNNAETSILLKTAISPPSEKISISTARQKETGAGDVCVAPVTIDISFIYACH